MRFYLKQERTQWRKDWHSLRPTLREFIRKWHQRSSRRHQLILVLLILTGIVMRLQFMQQPIRTDEAVTYMQYASGNLLRPLYDYSEPNNHILHTIGVSITTRLLGNSEWAIRLTTFISGIVLIPMTYIMTALLIRRQPALIGAGLVAVGAGMIEYSANARGYMLQANLLLLMVVFLLLWQQTRNRFFWLGIVVSASLGFYTIPTMLYGFGGVMLWWLAGIATKGKNRGEDWRWWFGAGVAALGLTLLLYSPVLLARGLTAITDNVYVRPQSFDELARARLTMAEAIWAQWHTDIPFVVQLILIIGFLWGLRQERNRGLPLSAALVIFTCAVLFVQRVAPFSRVFLIFFPVYAATLAGGLHALGEKAFGRRGHVISIGILLCFVGWQAVTITQTQSPYWSMETGTMRDAEAIIRDLAPEINENVLVIHQHPSEKSLEYYAMRYNVDTQYVRRSYRNAPIVFVVVNHEYGHHSEGIFRDNGLRIENYDLVGHWRSYPLADVYQYVFRSD